MSLSMNLELKDGVVLDYLVWIEHGEVTTTKNQSSMSYVGGSSNSGVHIGDQYMGNVIWENNFSHYQEMVFDHARPKFGMCSQPCIEVPNR